MPPPLIPGIRDIANAVADVLGDRLLSVVVYGSAATGDILEGSSDLDLLILVNGSVDADDSFRLHERVAAVDITPFTYVQPTYSRPEDARPLLIEGSFTVITGPAPPVNAFQTDDDLHRNGEEWLEELPSLVRRDLVDWSLAILDVHRRTRLALTRLKPAVRALLVRHGSPPVEAWSAAWAAMILRLEDVDPELAELVRSAVTAARSGADAHSVGAAALAALLRICALISHPGDPNPLIITE